MTAPLGYTDWQIDLYAQLQSSTNVPGEFGETCRIYEDRYLY